MNLEKKLAEQHIVIPGNPFWDVFKRFGRDEALAMVINVLGTAGMTYGINNFELDENTKNMTLSLVGPVIEKVGFFPAHIKEALEVYKTTPEDKRKELSFYIKKAMKNGSTSLIEDILVHDPVYIGLMYKGLDLLPNAPPWLVATASFIASVFIVAGLEVGVNEARYWNYKRKLKDAGFGIESYLESRFLIKNQEKPEELLGKLAKEFDLNLSQTGFYNDKYLGNNLPEYSGRSVKVRLRDRLIWGENTQVKSAQIVFTRASEIGKNEAGQFRYFPQKKDKIYFILNQNMPNDVDGIENENVRKMLKKVTNSEHNNIYFRRTIARNPQGLLAAVDQVNTQRPFYVLELKARNDANLLKEAMRYVMFEFPVSQTTYGKFDLVM